MSNHFSESDKESNNKRTLTMETHITRHRWVPASGLGHCPAALPDWRRLLCSLSILVLGTVASADGEGVPQVALGVPEGPQIALWQAAPNPNKPYIAQLFAPGDKPLPLLDDSPPDHFHHHGLMFAISVDDTDFWAEKGIGHAGRQQPLEKSENRQADGFTRELNWLAQDDTLLVEETRKVRVRVTGKDADAVHWLDWQSKLSPAGGRDSVRLSGAHYFGLGMRFLPAWTGTAGFSWQSAANPPEVGGPERVTPGGWCAASCEIDGRPVTVLMIDHPANPRPVTWFTMTKPFCYLSATLGLNTKPIELAAGKSLTLRYGIAVLAGAADRVRLEKLAEEWRSTDSNTAEPVTPRKTP